MFSQETLDKLKKIIKEDYNKDLSDKELRELAEGMVGYFDLLAKIHHRKS